MDRRIIVNCGCLYGVALVIWHVKEMGWLTVSRQPKIIVSGWERSYIQAFKVLGFNNFPSLICKFSSGNNFFMVFGRIGFHTFEASFNSLLWLYIFPGFGATSHFASFSHPYFGTKFLTRENSGNSEMGRWLKKKKRKKEKRDSFQDRDWLIVS